MRRDMEVLRWRKCSAKRKRGFFSGPRSLHCSTKLSIWAGAAIYSDYNRKKIDYRYVLYMTLLQKTRTIPLNTAARSHIEFHPKYTHFSVNKKGLLPPAERDYFTDNSLLREAEQYNTGFGSAWRRPIRCG